MLPNFISFVAAAAAAAAAMLVNAVKLGEHKKKIYRPFTENENQCIK